MEEEGEGGIFQYVILKYCIAFRFLKNNSLFAKVWVRFECIHQHCTLKFNPHCKVEKD